MAGRSDYDSSQTGYGGKGFWESIFGQSAYNPNKKSIEGLEGAALSNVAPGGMQYFQPQRTYTYKGRTITQDEYDKLSPYVKGDAQVTLSPSEYQTSKPNFNYNPGSSGYSMMGGNYNYNPSSLSNYIGGNYNFYDQAAKALGGQTNQALEGAKTGAQSGMDMMMSSLGQRGIAGGGMASMGLGNVANTLSKNMADINRQNALGLSNLQQQQQQMNLNANQAQNQYNLQQDQMREQQAQFAPQYNMQRMMSQYDLDKALRGEQYGYWKDPYNDMTNLYRMMAGLSQPESGLLGKIGGTIKGVNSIGSGMSSWF